MTTESHFTIITLINNAADYVNTADNNNNSNNNGNLTFIDYLLCVKHCSEYFWNIFSFILTTALWIRWYNYSLSTNKETEAQGG